MTAEDQGSGNTSDAAETDEAGGAEGSFPLTTDVVGLVGHDGRDVCVDPGCDEEDTEVAHRVLLGETHERETDEGQDTVEDDDGASDVVFVADPGGAEHDDTGERVRWGDQALRGGNAEAHPIPQDDGQEVCNGIGYGRGAQEAHGEPPDLQVQSGAQKLAESKGLEFGVPAISLDAVDDELDLPVAQELP